MPNKELGIADPVYDALRIRSGQSIAPDLGGGSFGAGGLENKIYVWHADGSTLDLFDPDAAGLDLALAAAASGDAVFIPAATISGDHTIPASVGVVAIQRRAAILTGEITLSASSSLQGLTIARTANSGSDLIAVLGPDSGAAYLYDCDVSALQAGAADGFALVGQVGGNLYHRFCVLTAQSSGADSSPISSTGSSWSIGATVSTGSITVTSETGNTIGGLTVGQWYAVECTGGPWLDGNGGSWYRYQLSNSGTGGFLVTINELNGNIPAWCSFREMPDATHIRVYFQATTTSILIRVGDLPGFFFDNTGSLGWKLSLATAPSGTVIGYASVIQNVAGRIATEIEGGDRGAYNTNDNAHAIYHASDIEAGTFLYHNNPNVPQDVLGNYIFVASQIGAALDTDLISGGGTNDTSPLQDILNIAAASGSRVLLIMDGPALISGLDVYSNTTIYCLEGAGFYLANGSNREVVRNANRSRTTITDEHIALIGGYYNANHSGQTGAGSTGHQQTDETFMNGISMFGVNYLDIRGVTVANMMGFGINTGNANYVTMHDLRIDAGSSPHVNQDGIHLNGPQSYVYISNAKIYSYDDAIAINAGDDTALDITIGNIHGPYVGQGLLSNVIIDGVELVGALRGIRILSHDSNSRIDQVHISNVTGSVAWMGLFCNPETGNGDIGVVTIDGWDVRQLSDAHGDRAGMYWNGNIERLALSNVEMHKPIDTRPILYFHTGFVGQSVTLDGFHDYDSSAAGGTPISVKGHIVRFDGAELSWVRNASGRGTALILLDNAASRIEFVTLDGVIVDNVNFVFSQTAGTVPTTILAANINHLVPSTNATFSTTGGTITDVCISNWYGYDPFSGTATTKRGDAFGGGAIALNDLSDVDTTGTGTGDVIYNNAGTWEDYPLGVGSRVTVSGTKIRFGGIAGGNYFEIDAVTGTVRLVGDATTYDDFRVEASVVKPGATAPNWKAFGPSGNLQALMFEASHHDEAYFEMQLPHNWKIGSNIYPHVHWTPVNATAGNVVWELEYSWANVGSAFGAPGNMATDATAAGGTAWVHKLTDFKESGNNYISGAGKTLSSMLVCRLHRNSNAGSDTLNQDVALLEVDFHYQIDSLGSDEPMVKDASASLLLETGDILLLETGDRLLTE